MESAAQVHVAFLKVQKRSRSNLPVRRSPIYLMSSIALFKGRATHFGAVLNGSTQRL